MENRIRVFSFCATLRSPEQSFTARFSHLVCEKIRETAAEAGIRTEIEIRTGSDVRIDYCRGCENCFNTGNCSLDGQDGMAALKRGMLDCDLLLFGSPVYTGSMSGLAKTILDRLGCWTHRFELAGKPVAILVTTSNNHGQETADELRFDFTTMGASVAWSGFAARHEGKPNIHLPEDMDPLTDRIARNLLEAYWDPVKFLCPEQEALFRHYRRENARTKAFCSLAGSDPSFETLAFYERGMDQYNSFAEYVTDKRRSSGGI